MELTVEAVLLALSFIIGLVLRYIPHLRFRYPSTPDAYFFMNKFRDPEYESEEVDYPKLLYQLFRALLRNHDKIPDRTINKTTPIFDVITAVSMYAFLRLLYGAETSILAVLLFLVTPFTVRHGVSLSGRPFGLMLFTISLLCLTLPFPYNWIAAFPMALVLLSHRLSTQTLFFVCLAFSFLDLQVGFILTSGFLIAVLVSRGEYLRILRNHAITIVKYMRKGHYPNRRLMGLVLVPSFVGFVVYAGILVLQNIAAFPIQLGYFSVDRIVAVNAYAESLFLIWCAACLLLLIFWVAGESFRHLYLAAMPFAFFSAFVLQSGQLFAILFIVLVLSSIGMSLRIVLRYEHLDDEFVAMLLRVKEIPESIRFIVPYGFLRAAEYFTYKKGIALHFPEYDIHAIAERIDQEGVTCAIVNDQNIRYFNGWKEIGKEGKWSFLERK